MNVLGERIKKLREQHNLSQIRLARALGITNVQLSRYETGDRNPDPEIIKKIADYFNCTTDYLLGLSDNQANNKSEEIQFTFKGKPLDDELMDLLTIILERLQNADEDEKRFLVRLLKRIMADESPGEIRKDLDKRG
jgi:transcriptional regulator with XRE-family HTH domain